MNDIISKIKTLKTNSDYRITDVVFRKGFRWRHSAEMVLSKPEYDMSILKTYLLSSKTSSPNLKLLVKCIEHIRDSKNIATPSEDEIVIHLRMGDAVELSWFNVPYIEKLHDKIDTILENNSISKITLVTCFAYQAWSPESIHLKPNGVSEWNYTDEKQQINIDTMTSIVDSLSKKYSQVIDIQSSEIPDEDIVYCTSSKFFIEDFRQPKPGGFSMLLKKLNNINMSN